MRNSGWTCIGRFAAALALAAVAGEARANSAADVFYERALMSAAGDRCGLFTPAVGAALTAASRQAHGAALRAGTATVELKAVETRARDRAAALPCGSKDLAMAADRVRNAFAGYARLYKMSFPGTLASWQADRTQTATTVRWRLSQSAAGGAVTFGVASDQGGLTAVTTVADAASASGARLILRDPTLAPSPFLDPRRADLTGRAAPRYASAVFLASARGPAPAGLLPLHALGGAAFRFPASAAAALDALDPREAVTLELVFPGRDGDRIQTFLFEVGDFAAGRAFLAAQP